MGADAVLADVPYLGMDWQTYLDGPQDFSLPSAMRAVMLHLGEPEERDYKYYLAMSGQAYQQVWHPETGRAGFDDPWLMDADPGHSVRRMFAAAGYGYRVVGIPEACEEAEAPIVASIDAGRPAILLCRRRPCGVVTGYKQGGKELVGWVYVFEPEGTEYDEHGYVRLPDWLDWTCGAIIVGEKAEAQPIADTLRDALVWAVNAARTPRIGEWIGGLEAINTWAQALTPDPDLEPDDTDAFARLFEAHDCTAMTLAEGRAYGGSMLERTADLWPDAADDLIAAGNCHGLIHDLMWRVWQTPEGSWPGNASRERFARIEDRRELRRIAETVRDLDTKAINLMAKALVTMGVDPADIAPSLEWEAEVLARLAATEAASGANPDARSPVHAGVSAVGVPRLAFGRGRDCTFIGALEAALAPTAHEVPYHQLMGFSGLAFRTRWFHNPEGAQTPWGDGRWHPISPHGEGPEEIDAISRATGWRLRVEDVPEAPRALGREKLATDAVLSLGHVMPAVVGLNTDMACVWGYRIHSMSLMVHDYQRPDEEEVLVTAYDEGLHSPFVFLDGFGEPLPARDALLAGLTVATRSGWRVPADGFLYGLAALDAWREDLGEYEACDAAERELLQTVNWWTLMHLLDARRAAVDFLELNVDLADAGARPALDRAIARYQEEVALLRPFVQEHRDLIAWHGGFADADWDADTRREQADLLAEVRAIEEDALESLKLVVAALR